MNSENRLRFLPGILITVAATTLVLVFASTANAGKSFSMVGEWSMNRAILVDIPINGGPQTRLEFAEPKNAHKLTAPVTPGGGNDHGACVGGGNWFVPFPPTTSPPVAPRFPWPRSAAVPIFGFRQKLGGIPGAAALTTTGTGRSFTIPDNAFNQVGPPTGFNSATVMLVPTVVQLQTDFTASGPANAVLAADALPTFAIQQPARFMKDAWSKDVGQAGRPLPSTPGIPTFNIRPAADFAWCPGTVGAGGVCPAGATTPGGFITGGTGDGPVDGIVRYKAGVNKFGGTMAMMLKGGGSTSIRAGSTTVPATTITLGGGAGFGRTMLPFIAHLPFGTDMAIAKFNQPQVQGVGYAFNNTITLKSARFHLDYLTSLHVSGVTNGGGMITTSGPTTFVTTTTMGTMTMMNTMTFGFLGADTNNGWGFPWTTGAVSVMNVELQGASPQTDTLTAQGFDGRDANGNGAITLVAGGTTNRVLSGNDFAALDLVTLVFDDGLATPSMGTAGLATVATLLALSAGFVLRRRFASEE